MTNLPDDQFESHLKQFRPLAPEPMQFEQRKPSVWPRRKTAAWAALAAAVIVALLFAFRLSRQSGSDHVTAEKIVAPSPDSLLPQPLTIGSGNALLAHAPSFEAAVDELSSPPRTSPLPPGKQSALKVLSQENIKL